MDFLKNIIFTFTLFSVSHTVKQAKIEEWEDFETNSLIARKCARFALPTISRTYNKYLAEKLNSVTKAQILEFKGGHILNLSITTQSSIFSQRYMKCDISCKSYGNKNNMTIEFLNCTRFELT